MASVQTGTGCNYWRSRCSRGHVRRPRLAGYRSLHPKWKRCTLLPKSLYNRVRGKENKSLWLSLCSAFDSQKIWASRPSLVQRRVGSFMLMWWVRWCLLSAFCRFHFQQIVSRLAGLDTVHYAQVGHPSRLVQFSALELLIFPGGPPRWPWGLLASLEIPASAFGVFQQLSLSHARYC